MIALVLTCPVCDGKGLVTAQDPYQPVLPAHLIWCPQCEGTGAILDKEKQ